MLGFIKKDLLLIKNNLKSLFVLLFVYVMMALGGNFDISFMIPYVFIVIFISTFSYDEYNHFDAFAISLPKGRKNIIKAKYISALIITIISITITLLLSLLLNSTKGNIDFMNLFSDVLLALTSVSILISILFPLIFKLGIEKGRIALLILVVIFVLCAQFLFKNINVNIDIKLIENMFNNYWFILLPLLNILFLYISFIISKKIYSKKEF